jgi:hypothetical protein
MAGKRVYLLYSNNSHPTHAVNFLANGFGADYQNLLTATREAHAAANHEAQVQTHEVHQRYRVDD